MVIASIQKLSTLPVPLLSFRCLASTPRPIIVLGQGDPEGACMHARIDIYAI